MTLRIYHLSDDVKQHLFRTNIIIVVIILIVVVVGGGGGGGLKKTKQKKDLETRLLYKI